MTRYLPFAVAVLVASCGGSGNNPSAAASPDSAIAADAADTGLSGAEWCVTHPHTVCDDYEPDRDSTWELSALGTGAAVTVSTDHATSPPNSLRALAPRGTATSVRAARVWKPLPASAIKTVHGEADVWVEAAPGDTLLLKFFFTDRLVGISTGPTGLKVLHKLSSGWPTAIASGSALGTGAWHHVELDLNTSAATVSVKIDGTVVLPSTGIPMTFSSNTPVEFYAGAELLGATTEDTVVFFDNVAFDRT